MRDKVLDFHVKSWRGPVVEKQSEASSSCYMDQYLFTLHSSKKLWKHRQRAWRQPPPPPKISVLLLYPHPRPWIPPAQGRSSSRSWAGHAVPAHSANLFPQLTTTHRWTTEVLNSFFHTCWRNYWISTPKTGWDQTGRPEFSCNVHFLGSLNLHIN